MGTLDRFLPVWIFAAMALGFESDMVVCDGDDAKLLDGEGSLRDLSIDAVS